MTDRTTALPDLDLVSIERRLRDQLDRTERQLVELESALADMLRARQGATLFSRRDTDTTLNRFVRLTAGTRMRQGLLVLSAASATKILSLLAATAAAQRVQFPIPAQPVQTTSPYMVTPPSGPP